MTFMNLEMNHDDDDQEKIPAQVLDFDNESSSCPLAPGLAHAAFRPISNLFASAKFCSIVRLMAREETQSAYASRVKESMTRAFGKALFDELQLGYKSANAGLKVPCGNSFESELMSKAHNNLVDGVVDQNVER